MQIVGYIRARVVEAHPEVLADPLPGSVEALPGAGIDHSVVVEVYPAAVEDDIEVF